ncbi:hypothetical protein VU06_03905 [Desulfobulbus sp. F3]|nr:hypothetical protein [Desulfobulbus sp. F3]
MREVKKVLANDCRVTVPEKRMDEILAKDMAVIYLIKYRENYEHISVGFTDMQIEFPANGEAAVQATVQLTRQKPQVSPAEVTAPVTLTMRNEDGAWLLTRTDLAAVLIND